MTDEKKRRIHVGTQIDDEMAHMVILAGLELGREAPFSDYWGPDLGPVKDGWVEVTMKPKAKHA
jgi:hypothetical protein